MIRIITALLGAGIGYGLGMLVDYSLAGAALGAIAGFTMAAPGSVIFNREERASLAQALDRVILTYWIAGPALKNLADARPGRLEHYENEIFEAFLPEIISEHTYNRAEIVMLARQTTNIGTEPSATIRRHNRKFAPNLFRRTSPTYNVLRTAGTLLVEGGAERDAIAWYLHTAKRLKVKPNVALGFIFEALEGQMAQPTMIPGIPQADSPLVLISRGIDLPPGGEEYLALYEAEKMKVRDVMFGTSEQVA